MRTTEYGLLSSKEDLLEATSASEVTSRFGCTHSCQVLCVWWIGLFSLLWVSCLFTWVVGKPRCMTCCLIHSMAEGAFSVHERTFKNDTWCYSLNNCRIYPSYLNNSALDFILRLHKRKCWGCRYTVSGPTWIGPGHNVTCTLLEERVVDWGRGMGRKR